MKYCFSKKVQGLSIEELHSKIADLLKAEGFGIITEIDVRSTLKQKIGVDFRNYRILGACNPHFAHKALQTEPYIGVFLPCNVIIDETEEGAFEVSAIDPVAAMGVVNNVDLAEIAKEIGQRLSRVIEGL